MNLVRYHDTVYLGSGPDFQDIDTVKLNNLFQFVYYLKQEGIYTTLSIYWPSFVVLNNVTGIPGYTGQNPWELLFWNPLFQSYYEFWWNTTLCTVNPYTNIPLKDDPSIFSLEIVNEDSILWWSFDPYSNPTNIPLQQAELLEADFGNWLVNKYGSLQNVTIFCLKQKKLLVKMIFDQVPWSFDLPYDNVSAGLVAFDNLWNIFNDRTPRDQDTAEFLTWQQMNFYNYTRNFLKNTLGYQGMVYGSNWITASSQYLDPLDKYSNLVGDYLGEICSSYILHNPSFFLKNKDRHNYYEGYINGPNDGWELAVTQNYSDASSLVFDVTTNLPIVDMKYNSKPSTISELNWSMPNKYEIAILVFLTP